jgi:2-polyprenyl-6-methoxyphenol hydroxylase-like FAD-dependent oxidoreductase
MGAKSIVKQCCIVGGGPAGMMLGFLLARAGVEAAVLEKHGDFLRDFRGDTVHPSTLELMHELGLLDRFLELPHRKVESLSMRIGDARIRMVDLRHLPTHCKYVALMPQWDFLNFLAKEGGRYPTFDLHMRTEATAIIEEEGRVVGVRARTPEGELTVRADLVVACDGRHSTLRAQAGLPSDDFGAPMDVLWFRVSRRQSDSPETFGNIDAGAMLVMLDRGDYWQCAYAIPKGGLERMKGEGIEALRSRVSRLAPFLADRVTEVRTFDDVKLLSVTVDVLRQWWRPGLLCIGDAAHAMSPIGGVGINIAVQDAVAAANRLAVPLRAGRVSTEDLDAIQHRRLWPARLTQRVQLALQNRVIGPALEAVRRPKPPMLFGLFNALPPLRRVPGRLLAVGFRPEHVNTPDMLASRHDPPRHAA